MEKIPTFQNKSSKFEQEIIIGNRVINLSLFWNARSEFWYLTFIDGTDEISSLKIVPNWLLLKQYKSKIPNFSGDLIVLKMDDDVENDITYDNLNAGWNLFYLTETEAESWEDFYGLG